MGLSFGNIGQAVGNALGGVDLTPGFNVKNPFNSDSKGWGGSYSPVGPTSGGRKQGGQFIEDSGSYGGSSGNVQGRTTYGATAAADPYAKYGGRQSYDRLVSGFDTQKGNIFSTSREAAQNAGIGYNSSILDFIDSLASGQRSIDERGVQNELAKKQGSSSVYDMVGRGIRSGGTMLAGRNASDSSAAERVAQAYGDLGGRELGKIGNQYAVEDRNIGLAQEDLGTQQRSGMRKLNEGKTQMVNGIVAEARNKLAALDASMAEADVPTRIEIEAEKNKIKQEAIGILSQFDQRLTKGVSGIKAASDDDNRRTAAGLATAGVAAENPFDFSTEAPAEFAGTGPFASELPLFTLNRRRQEA